MTQNANKNESIHESESLSLFELALSAIAKRPAYKRMCTEVCKQEVKTLYDRKGESLKDENKKDITETVYSYSEAMRITTLSNLMIKAVVSAMNDRGTNSIYVPSHMGKMCVYKTPLSESFKYEKVHSTVEFNGCEFGIIDHCLESGKLTKEMLTGLSGYHIGTLMFEAIGQERIYQAVVNSSNAVTTLSEDMLNFINTYTPTDTIMRVSWNLLKSGNCPADMYEDVIGGLSQQIKSDAKAAGVISNGQARSKVLPFLIGLRLKEMYIPQN